MSESAGLIGLIGALVGGAITLAGTYLTQRLQHNYTSVREAKKQRRDDVMAAIRLLVSDARWLDTVQRTYCFTADDVTDPPPWDELYPLLLSLKSCVPDANISAYADARREYWSAILKARVARLNLAQEKKFPLATIPLPKDVLDATLSFYAPFRKAYTSLLDPLAASIDTPKP